MSQPPDDHEEFKRLRSLGLRGLRRLHAGPTEGGGVSEDPKGFDDEELLQQIVSYDETLSGPDLEREAAIAEMRLRLATLRAEVERVTAERDTARREQMKAAIADDHPESRCEKCAGRNVSWYAPSYLWNAVARKRGRDLMLCPTCFALSAHASGVKTTWALIDGIEDGGASGVAARMGCSDKIQWTPQRVADWHAAQLAAERERCAKVVCWHCRHDVRLVNGRHPCVNNIGVELVGVGTVPCKAAAIRALPAPEAT